MPKHLDCNIRGADNRWRAERVWFPDSKLVAASGASYLLGRYRHKGSNGTLFECYDENKKQFAVKFLHQLDQQREDRFSFELLILADMAHARVLNCVDCGAIDTTLRDRQVPFMITPLYRGNLNEEVAKLGKLPVTKALRVAKQLCDAFDYVHAQGIIHRDLKAANLLLSGDDIVVGDFGLAKTATDAGVDRYYRPDITVADELVGPILWMSPELVRYQRDKTVPVDHRSDLFQVGLVIWFMLTGEIPRGPLDEDDDPTKGALHQIVSKLLQHKADKRFQSAKDLAAALEGVLSLTTAC